MQATKNSNCPRQGFRLNWQTWPKASDWPEWANPYQREKWEKKGLLLWDEETQQVTNLNGQQALDILDQFRHASDWWEEGCIVGEPAWSIPLNNNEHKGEPVLTNTINLNPQQTQAFFDFLVLEEDRLQQMKATEEKERARILRQVYSILIEMAEQGKHTIYDKTLSWEENKRIMRSHWDSGNFPDTLTFTEQRLWTQVLEEKQIEYKHERQKAQERELRIKKNLLSHHFFWERIKPLWLYLKANERLHILQRLQDTEWNQSIVTEIKQIVENAQFFGNIATKSSSPQEIDKMSGEELDILLDLDDELWHEFLALYRQKTTTD